MAVRPARALLLAALVGLAGSAAGCAKLTGLQETPTQSGFRIVGARLAGNDSAAHLVLDYASGVSSLVVSVTSPSGTVLGTQAAARSPANIPLPPLASYYDGRGPLTLRIVASDGKGARLASEDYAFYAPRLAMPGAARAVGEQGAGLAVALRNTGDAPAVPAGATLRVDGDAYVARVRNGTVYPDPQQTTTILLDVPGLGLAPGPHVVEAEVDFANAPPLVVNATGAAGILVDAAPLGWDEAGLTGLRLTLAGRGSLPVAVENVTLAFQNESTTQPLHALVSAAAPARLDVARPAGTALRPANGHDALDLRLADAQNATLAERNLTFWSGAPALNLTGATFRCEPSPGPCTLASATLRFDQTNDSTRYVGAYRLSLGGVNATLAPPLSLHQGPVVDDLALAVGPLRRGLANLSVSALGLDGSTIASTRARVDVSG
ncbi:MAG: hypothetical protein QOE90_3717 [Thermoplasmata archaeon]|nr:hypothetical protein [Thermoplasmata archaeon]